MKLLLFFIIVFVLLLLFRRREQFVEPKRFIHLVLYSDQYHDMYLSTRDYYSLITPTYYYSFSEDLSSDYELRGDRLLLKGRESYLPGILEKTVRALAVFKDYDYIIRSNASTVVDLVQLQRELSLRPIDYGGSFVHTLQWLDPANGITDRRHWGTRYASGTCIILSRRAVEQLLQSSIDYSVIDDVAIGVSMKQLKFAPKCFLERFVAVTEPKHLTQKWFYRHRTTDRVKDAANIKWLSKTLIHSLSRNG
jgi:hypothetical protein